MWGVVLGELEWAGEDKERGWEEKEGEGESGGK